MEVKLNVLSDNDCKDRIEQASKPFNQSTQLCAGRRGADTCKGSFN